MKAVTSIDVYEARDKVVAGKAQLVCAYDSWLKFRAVRLQGAMSRKEFGDGTSMADETIIFYCA